MASPEDRLATEQDIFYRSTGELIREFAELEEMLIFPLTALLSTDQFRAQIIWNSLPTGRPRLKLLERLGNTFLAELEAERFRSILKRIRTIAKNRNMLAHAHGGVGERVGTLVFIWDDDDDELGFNFIGKQTIQLSNIKTWTRDIVSVKSDFMAFLPVLRCAVEAAPKMHRR